MFLGYEGQEPHTTSVCKLRHWAAFAMMRKADDIVAQLLEPLINRLMFSCLHTKVSAAYCCNFHRVQLARVFPPRPPATYVLYVRSNVVHVLRIARRLLKATSPTLFKFYDRTH